MFSIVIYTQHLNETCSMSSVWSGLPPSTSMVAIFLKAIPLVNAQGSPKLCFCRLINYSWRNTWKIGRPPNIYISYRYENNMFIFCLHTHMQGWGGGTMPRISVPNWVLLLEVLKLGKGVSLYAECGEQVHRRTSSHDGQWAAVFGLG